MSPSEAWLWVGEQIDDGWYVGFRTSRLNTGVWAYLERGEHSFRVFSDDLAGAIEELKRAKSE